MSRTPAARTPLWAGVDATLFSVLWIWLLAGSASAGSYTLKFNRSHFQDLTDPCSRTGIFHATLNRSHPAALLKLDSRYKTLVTTHTFDCVIKVKTEFGNKSREFVYNDNEDLAVMMFDINYGYKRKEDAIKLDLIHIARLDPNGTRFFYQKKQFQLPQYVPKSLPGYVMYGFEEIAQWHAESNSSVAVHLRRWKSSSSIYFVFAQYRIVSPYHCNDGIEVDCNMNSAVVFAHCFPKEMMSLLLDGLPFCDFLPLRAINSNRTLCGSGHKMTVPSLRSSLFTAIATMFLTMVDFGAPFNSDIY